MAEITHFVSWPPEMVVLVYIAGDIDIRVPGYNDGNRFSTYGAWLANTNDSDPVARRYSDPVISLDWNNIVPSAGDLVGYHPVGTSAREKCDRDRR